MKTREQINSIKKATLPHEDGGEREAVTWGDVKSNVIGCILWIIISIIIHNILLLTTVTPSPIRFWVSLLSGIIITLWIYSHYSHKEIVYTFNYLTLKRIYIKKDEERVNPVSKLNPEKRSDLAFRKTQKDFNEVVF